MKKFFSSLPWVDSINYFPITLYHDIVFPIQKFFHHASEESYYLLYRRVNTMDKNTLTIIGCGVDDRNITRERKLNSFLKVRKWRRKLIQEMGRQKKINKIDNFVSSTQLDERFEYKIFSNKTMHGFLKIFRSIDG